MENVGNDTESGFAQNKDGSFTTLSPSSNGHSLNGMEFTSLFLEVPNPNDENCTLGITTEEGLGLEVYPNPFTNTLNISSQQPIQQVNIYNIQGKIISKISGNSLEFLDVSNLSSGVYLIQFSSSELSVTQKLIKL